MFRLISIMLLIAVIENGYAQTLTILDRESQIPLELVTIYSQYPEAYATTNANGQADLNGFTGAEKIEIRYLGFKSIETSYDQLKALEFLIYMEPANFRLSEVVVSGTRWRQTSDNVPSKIISISPAEVQLQNPQTAADLLGISGQVFIQKSQQGGGSPMIRGFATNRLLYVVDGVRMNNAIFRGGNIQNVINLDPFATERTEVVFGPGSVIYGSDAIGGIMSFKTLTPQFSTDQAPLISGKIIGRYSSANKEKTGHADINIGWKKFSSMTSVSHWNYDNLRQGNHGPKDYLKDYYVVRENGEDAIKSQEDPLLQIPSGYSQINLMQKFGFNPNQKWDMEYGLHFSQTSTYGRYDRHNRIRGGNPQYALWNYGPQKWMMNYLEIDHHVNYSLVDEVSLRIAHQLFEESRIDRTFGQVDQTSNKEKVKAYSANLDALKSINNKHTLFYGLEYVRNEVNSSGEVQNIENKEIAVGPSRYPEADWSSLGIYVTDEYTLSDKLTLSGGLRYNFFKLNADFGNNATFYPLPFTTTNLGNGGVSGSIGAVIKPSDHLIISTNLGTAFRTPNVDDIGKIFDSEPGAVTVPNPELKSEYAYNADVGFATFLGNNIKLDATFFYTKLQNALVRRDFTLNGQDSVIYGGILSQVQAIQNAALANVLGLQIGLEIKILKGLSFSSDLNFQKGEEEGDDGSISSSRHAAPLFGVVRLNYKTKKLSLQLYAMFQGERSFEDLALDERRKDEIYAKDESGNNFSPSWYTLNFNSSLVLTEFFNLGLGIENITDQRYRPYSSGISGSGRNIYLSVRFEF